MRREAGCLRDDQPALGRDESRIGLPIVDRPAGRGSGRHELRLEGARLLERGCGTLGGCAHADDRDRKVPRLRIAEAQGVGDREEGAETGG